MALFDEDPQEPAARSIFGSSTVEDVTHQASRLQTLSVHPIEDEIDTVSAFETFFARERNAFWLDSPPGSGGRYSLLGSGENVLAGGFDQLDQTVRHTREAEPRIPTGLPAALACGWVGYFAYEPDDSRWLVPNRFLVVDHQERQSWAVAAGDPRWPALAASRAVSTRAESERTGSLR